jgi:cystathionine gamma-synthase
MRPEPRFETLAVHAGGEADAHNGAIAPPLHLSTTFKHGPAAERLAGYEYQREGNPTQDRLETALAALDGGEAALAYGSGMAAMTAALELLPAGSEVLIPEDCYAGLRSLGAEFLPERGVTVRRIDQCDATIVAAAMSPAVKLIWAETPSNPQLRIADLRALSAIAKQHGALLAVDNTFATPALQQPIALGADVVMHSTTKYMGGHSDVMGGALVFAKRDGLFERAAHRRHITGNILAPFSAWLTLRGLRSMPARMAWHCANARRVAEFLAKQPAVETVYWPGLTSHRNHDVATRQMRDFGGMVSVTFKEGRDAALAFAGAVEVFTNATSLGGVESLVEHRASVEGPNPVSPPGLLRLSVGLEHPDDLVADLQHAVEALG